MKQVALISAALLLAGCAITRRPQLVPENEAARAQGPLRATLVGRRHGDMRLALPDGELLSGRYSIASRGKAGLGTQYDYAAVAGGAPRDSAFGASAALAASGVGTAEMTSRTGVRARCEFVDNVFTGHGSGSCELSTGAVFRMRY